MKHTFHVHGMHCKACVILIEDILKEVPGVDSVHVNLHKNIVEVDGDFKETDVAKLADNLSSYVASHGYKFSIERETKKINWNDFVYAIPIAVLLIVAFFLLQKINFVGLINSSKVGFTTAFLIGMIASVSTCLAVVGGLVLSMSAAYVKGGDKWKPQIMFHAGRLGGFFILGGLIGLLGSAFQLSVTSTLVLNIIIGIVMIILGINLLDVFHFTKRIQPTAPKFFSKFTFAATEATHVLAPLLVGTLTFFLPCGFTQSMQIYTLSTGNFLTGALTMFTFALGTFPVLALLSFGSFSFNEKPYSGVFFKTAGFIVIAFAVFNLINGLVGAGIINPVFNF
jgi:sulfite exporter TauE/SafE/copper chaperone CopZ